MSNETPENNETDNTETTEKNNAQEQQQEEETFTAEYVKKLRAESAEYRTRAKDRDQLAEQLFFARVAATGRLADPTDLPFDEKLLADMPALEQAIEELVARRPHYAARRPQGNVGQGEHTNTPNRVDLGAMLRARA